jgi:hypothetical protein
MPPLPVIADVFRVTLDWITPGGIPCHNVMHFEAPSKTSAQVFAALDSHVTASMWSTIATTAHVFNVDVLPLDGSSPTSSFAVAGAPAKWSGNGGSDWTSRAPAAIIKQGTGARGPSRRGRVFLPFTTEQDISQGTIDPAVVGAVTTGWVTFANAMAVSGVALGVASYTHSSWHQTVDVALHNTLGTLRRRQKVLRP